MLDVKKVIGVIRELEGVFNLKGSAPLLNLGVVPNSINDPDYKKHLLSLVKNADEKLPFKRVRVYARMTDVDIHTVIESRDDIVSNDGHTCKFVQVNMSMSNAITCVTFRYSEEEGNFVNAKVYLFTGGELREWKAPSEGAEMALAIAIQLLLNCNAFGSHLVEVTPNTKACNKAMVQWVKANTYYEVVHRRHAANSKDVKEGQVVKEELITRVAHARRAHMRILRAARYGSNQGKVLYIKNTWVGPKEWKDAESRQIYRIVK